MIDALTLRISSYRFGLMLCALLSLTLITPLLGNSPKAEAEAATLFSIILIGLGLTAMRPLLTTTISTIWILLVWLTPFYLHVVSSIAVDLMLVMVCLLAIEGALKKALQPTRVGAEELCAAISAYFLMGILFAGIYAMILTLDPIAFELSGKDLNEPWNAMLYFSFATLTTLGYGDITPVSSVARAWASIEAIFGTIFLAVLIAHLVGNFSRRSSN